MGLQGCSNIYMLILLLSAIAVINAQAAPSGNDTSVSILASDNDSNNDSNVNTSDDDSKNNSSTGDNNNDPNVSTGDDSKNDTSVNTGDDNGKNNTSVNTGNDNGKNDTSASTDNGDVTGDDVKHDIRIITACIMHTKIIGTLAVQVTQLTKLVFVFVPNFRDQLTNYFNYLFAFIINVLLQLIKSLQKFIKFLTPFSRLGIIFT
ncbi:unnamed protein product [Lasius platythorax]|uniref:Uncharacterized protein n=1 Tax=Lasius platythorax TaxID=488582 RepID=A0AAV2NRA5_9HYME